MKWVFWWFSNLYGKVFGWSILAPIHHALVTLSLHALGYGNAAHDSLSGEEWFLKRILKRHHPKIVFDVGANVGDYTRLLIKHTEAEIYSFEPNPSAHKKLSELPRIHAVKAAVSELDGQTTLYFKNELDEKASLDSSIRSGNEIVVNTTRLDTFAQQHEVAEIDFLKIDTEGFEREVLQGLGALRPRFIQFEFNINHLQRDYTLLGITRLLPDYTFYRLFPNGWKRISPKRYIDNIFIYCNIVAVRTS